MRPYFDTGTLCVSFDNRIIILLLCFDFVGIESEMELNRSRVIPHVVGTFKLRCLLRWYRSWNRKWNDLQAEHEIITGNHYICIRIWCVGEFYPLGSRTDNKAQICCAQWTEQHTRKYSSTIRHININAIPTKDM